MRRREFLIASSLGVVLPATLAQAANTPVAEALAAKTSVAETSAAASRIVSSADIHALVYEPRYAVARAFAEQHAERGIRVFSVDDCMVRLWRGPLTSGLQHDAPIRIAGTTLYSDFALARDCARERGFRVLREECLKTAPVTLVHWLIGIA